MAGDIAAMAKYTGSTHRADVGTYQMPWKELSIKIPADPWVFESRKWSVWKRDRQLNSHLYSKSRILAVGCCLEVR